ncbi:hypothetical protein ACGFNU_32765 [Spirillospora sp. NPDC048911]
MAPIQMSDTFLTPFGAADAGDARLTRRAAGKAAVKAHLHFFIVPLIS